METTTGLYRVIEGFSGLSNRLWLRRGYIGIKEGSHEGYRGIYGDNGKMETTIAHLHTA